MFRTRGENLRSVFVLLFLYVAFFLIETQDAQKYARLFSFQREAVSRGEIWRLVTYQFTQPGKGFMGALSLFITLLLLFVMGTAIEEEWGTAHFLTLFAASTLGSAAVGAFLGVPLLGTYFVFFTLLFVYASAFPGQTFYLMGIIPVRVRVLAFFSLAVLMYGVFTGGAANLSALGGSVVAYLYYLSQRVAARRPEATLVEPPRVPQVRIDTTAIHNAARFAAINLATGSGSAQEMERLASQCERDIVRGVNICPPADYKPADHDGYCVRCEGFAECSARYLRLRLLELTPQG